VAYTLRNLGGAPAGPFDVGFVLVPVTPAGPDIAMGPTRTGVLLPAGGTLVSSTPVVVPGSVTPGQYRVRVVTDAGGAVTEVMEANNETVTGVVTITPPDLNMAGLVVPSVGVAGRTIGIRNSVINTATAPGTSPAFQVGLYLSADGDIDVGADTLRALRTVTPLGPGVTSTATTPVALPTTPGSYFIGAIADRAGVVIEANESNNVEAGAIDIVPEMIRNRAATANVTTSNCILPVNNATLGLSGTLTISTHTGTAWSGTVRLPNNTATLTGTVDTGGNISGSFTIVNSGGARGGGSFSGSAGSGPTGGFSATFSGGFTFGEVCTINASVSAP
jgi:subtilase family serine protease